MRWGIMAAITWTDVADLAPELVNWPNNAVDAAARTRIQDLILGYVNNAMNVNVLDGEDGERTKLVRTLLAAHFATMLTRASTNKAGAVVAESLGPQSRAYAQMSGVLTDRLQSTHYGIQYQFLIRSSAARGPRVL